MRNRVFFLLVYSSAIYGLDIVLGTTDIESVSPIGLRYAMEQINAAPSLMNSITIPPAYSLLNGQTANLPPIEISNGNTLTIFGPPGDATLNGDNLFRGFFVSSGNLVIDQMKITNARARGGDGGSGGSPGGGGMGAGGSFFVKSGTTLALSRVSITNSRAQGGTGGTGTAVASAGGGGGLGGSGGEGNLSGGGGGGLFGNGGVGSLNGGGSGGGGGFGNGGMGDGIGFPQSGGGGGAGVTPLGANGQNGAAGLGGNGGGNGTGGIGGNQLGNPTPNGTNGNFDKGGGGGVGDNTNPGYGGDGGDYGGGGGGGDTTISADVHGGDGGMYGGGGSGGIGNTLLNDSGKGGFGGGGAGGTANILASLGGMGDFGGGGGGSVDTVGANGGFGGGGGGGTATNAGGAGGSFAGSGGSGGGIGGYGGGGGGAGLGGAIFIHRDGTVILYDNTSFTGSTVVSGLGGAPLVPGFSGLPGQALGRDIFMMASAQLTFDIDDILQIDSNIAGDGGLGGGATNVNGVTKLGVGTVILNGTNSYSGFTNVLGGTLLINGFVRTPTIVSNGATLKGNGTVNNSVTIQNGGIFFPGSISTVFHANSIQLDPLSLTILQANPAGNSTFIDIDGSAALSGTLLMQFDPGTYQEGQLFTILNASGGVSGQFSSTQTSSLVYEMVYNPTSVQVKIPCSTCEFIPIAPLWLEGIQGNARRVGKYLNAVNAQLLIQPQFEALRRLSTAQLFDALKSISPGGNAFSAYISQDTMFSLNKVVTTRMSIQRSIHSLGRQQVEMASLLQEAIRSGEGLFADAGENLVPGGSTTRAAAGVDENVIWASGIGEFVHQEAQKQTPAFHATTAGGLVGFETYRFSNILVGATAGYAESDIDMEQKAGSGKTNYYVLGLYETTYFGNGYMEFCLWGTYNRFHNKRHIAYPGFDKTAESAHSGWQLIPSLSFGYDFGFKWGVIEPFASLDAAIAVEKSFSEKKAFPYNMRQAAKTSEFLRFETGLNAYETWTRQWGSVIIRESLSYVLRKPYKVGTVNATIIGAPGSFTVYSFTDQQNILSPGAEIFWKHKSGAFASATYSGEFGFGSGYMSNEVIGKIGVYF